MMFNLVKQSGCSRNGDDLTGTQPPLNGNTQADVHSEDGLHSVAIATPDNPLHSRNQRLANISFAGRPLPERQISQSSDDAFCGALSELSLSDQSDTKLLGTQESFVATKVSATIKPEIPGEPETQDEDGYGWTTVTRKRRSSRKTPAPSPCSPSPKRELVALEALVNITANDFARAEKHMSLSGSAKKFINTCGDQPHKVLSRLVQKVPTQWSQGEYVFLKSAFFQLIRDKKYTISVFQMLVSCYLHYSQSSSTHHYKRRLNLLHTLQGVYPKLMNYYDAEDYQSGVLQQLAKDFIAIYQKEGEALISKKPDLKSSSSLPAFFLMIRNMHNAIGQCYRPLDGRLKRDEYNNALQQLAQSIKPTLPGDNDPVKRKVVQGKLFTMAQHCVDNLVRVYGGESITFEITLLRELDNLEKVLKKVKVRLSAELWSIIEHKLYTLRIRTLPCYSKVYGYDQTIEKLEMLREELLETSLYEPEILSAWLQSVNFQLANRLLLRVQDCFNESKKQQDYSVSLAKANQAIANFQRYNKELASKSHYDNNTKSLALLYSMYHRLQCMNSSYSDQQRREKMRESIKQLEAFERDDANTLEIAKWYILNQTTEDYEAASELLTNHTFKKPSYQIKQVRLLNSELGRYDNAINILENMRDNQSRFPSTGQIEEHNINAQLGSCYYHKFLDAIKNNQTGSEGSHHLIRTAYEYACQAIKTCSDQYRHLGLLSRVCDQMSKIHEPFRKHAKSLPAWLQQETINNWLALHCHIAHQHKNVDPLAVETIGTGILQRQKEASLYSSYNKRSQNHNRLRPK